MSRSLLASAVFVAVAALLGVFAWTAWHALADLPAPDRNVVATAPGARDAASAGDPGRRSHAPAAADEAQRAARAHPSTETSGANTLSDSASDPREEGGNAPSGGAAREDAGRVRYLNASGIVSPVPDGPLTRLPTPVEPAPQPPPTPERYRLVIVESAGMIDARSLRIRLAGVEAPGADATCTAPDGRLWPCGRRARTALRRLVRRRAIDCMDETALQEADAGASAAGDVGQADAGADEGRRDAAGDVGGKSLVVSRCRVGKVDLSRWLVEQGWAEPAAGANDELRILHAAAREAGRGLYAPAPR